jgi:predicted 3-demethylubiquinone-9 3-methyltransferase (glyoxalase superfamily)
MMQKITTNLWFDGNAEEAVNFYSSIFKDSKIGNILRYGKEGYEIHGMPEGAVMTIDFEIFGQHFVALNGGTQFKFNESISFIIRCENQEEVDYYWEKLGAGGDENAKVCGWLKDKYGVSWQIIPSLLYVLLKNKEKSARVMNALLKMKKLNLQELQNAYDGKN